MIELMRSAQAEIDLLSTLLKNSYWETKIPGYDVDCFSVTNYIEDKDGINEYRYREEAIVDSMEALADLLNNAHLMEFEKPSIHEFKLGEPPTFIQVRAEHYGLWLRKTTIYCAFGVLGDQCPEHTDGSGYVCLTGDLCPEECAFVPKNKGLGPGTKTVYDVFVRTYPRLKEE